MQLGEPTGYGFVAAGYSGCSVKGKIILSCQQALARLIVADPKYKSLEVHHVFDFRAWDIFIVARLHGLLKTVEKRINCFVWPLSYLLEAMTGRKDVVLGAPQFRQLLQSVF